MKLGVMVVGCGDHCLKLGEYLELLFKEELVQYFLEFLNARHAVPKSVEMIVFIVPDFFLILKPLYDLRVVPT